MAQEIKLDQKEIADLISPQDAVPVSEADKTLGAVLPLVSSSHEAVFVNDNGEFLGLISPHQALYAGSSPHTAKVRSILFVPPRITSRTTVNEAAEHMLASKIYGLPVFDANEPVGLISAQSVLNFIAGNPRLLKQLSESIKPNAPITANINSSISEIYNLLKDKEVSRVILVADNGQLAGIVTRSDLMSAFIKPRMRRFPPEGTIAGFYSKAGEKKYTQDRPARRYATTMVDSLPGKTQRHQIVERLIKSPYNSIVLVDGRRKPTGFCSMHDLLRAVASVEPDASTPILMIKPGDSVPQAEQEAAEKYLRQFANKLEKRLAVEKISVSSKSAKNSKSQPNKFNVTIAVTPVAGEPLIATSGKWSYLDGVQSAAAMIEKRRRRTGLSRKQTRMSSP